MRRPDPPAVDCLAEMALFDRLEPGARKLFRDSTWGFSCKGADQISAEVLRQRLAAPCCGTAASMPDRFVRAGLIWSAILALFRTPALTMPWSRVYVAPHALTLSYWRDIIAHERVHLAQIERDGPWTFSWLYLYGLARYGYWHMPYELEARAAHE